LPGKYLHFEAGKHHLRIETEKKHCEGRIDRQILKVQVLVGELLIDDDQTLESAGWCMLNRK